MRKFFLPTLAALLFAVLPAPAFAHALGARFSTPIPLSLYLGGAGAVVLVSFVMIGLFVRDTDEPFTYPRYNLLGASWFRHSLGSPVFLALLQVIAVFLFILTLVTGIYGNQDPDGQFEPTFVWIIWWVGFSFFAALIGNAWPVVNPWKIIFTWGDSLAAAVWRRDGLEIALPYPARLGVAPAAVLFFGFIWLENIYLQRVEPSTLAAIIIVYSLITWAGMVLFGRDTWLANGEAFSVLFRILGRFAPTELRVTHANECAECPAACGIDGRECIDCPYCFEWAAPEEREINLRPWAVGQALPSPIDIPMLGFILLILAGVTFDGVAATTRWTNLVDSTFNQHGVLEAGRYYLVQTSGLLGIWLTFVIVYFAFCTLIRWFGASSLSVQTVATRFITSIVPIALAYEIAHYFTLLGLQGQLLYGLISDPFGWGWNLFGTAGYQINGQILNGLFFNGTFVWYTEIALIVGGHVIAVYLAHETAVRQFRRRALYSQYPMLALMVLYTITSLWIIAQPIVQEAG